MKWLSSSLLLLLLIRPTTADSVLLIIADDLGRDSLTSYNDSPEASIPPTPAIDRLAENGILFERTYSYSTCSPTRAAILTGRYDFRTGVLSPEINELMPNEYTLAEAILDSNVIGDRLAQLGKWHLGGTNDAPNQVGGWPHFSGSIGGGIPNYSRWTKVTNGIATSRYSNYATTDLVDDAIAWIEEQNTQDWFLWVAFNAPHTPYHKPANSLHDYDHLSGTQEDIDANPREYYEAMVQAMDTEIERLLEVVDLESTTVIFLGDNGTPNAVLQEPFPSRHGKGSLYEGGVNVPLIISGSSVSPRLHDTKSNAIIHCVDLYMTILDLLNVDRAGLLPKQLPYDSQSFFPLLSGETARVRTFAYAAQPGRSPGSREIMLTDELYKWILFEDGTDEFYFVSDGLSEEDNRIAFLEKDQQTALEFFEALAASQKNEPRIHKTYYQAGKIHIEVGWFANANLSLKFRQDLSLGDWEAVDSFDQTENGTVLTTLSHITDQPSGFYRVLDN